MNIKPIEQITPTEQVELDKLKEKGKTKTDEEKNRELFLDIKQLWNCEC